ncbi:MAG: aldose 1-epimerase family protein [Nocardioidaceae bacterium]|nr:aldose 1-epimerase family protein [Nocardioidaceae bacterium]
MTGGDQYSPSGDQYSLTGFGYTATVTQVGAALRELTFEGAELVRGFGSDQMMPHFRGAVLAPWPNRVSDGSYRFGGHEHQLALNEAERRNALHGLVAFDEWRLIHQRDTQVTLAHRLWPQPGYPFRLDLEMTYVLGAQGFTWRLTAVNVGDRAAPYGCSIHPYFVAGSGSVDAWSLELPATHYLEVDELLRPIRTRPVEGSQFDFRIPRTIRETQIDNAYTGLTFDDRGFAVASLRSEEGKGVELRWDASCPWVQVHTADRPERELNRVGLALEPMTCPPDAFRTGTDLIVLEPADTHSVRWAARALP